MRRRPALIFGSTVLISFALAAPASAETFCVQEPACVGTAQGTLQAALDSAAVNVDARDSIRIGPVELTESAIDNAGNAVDVVGSGDGRTSITGTSSTSLIVLEPSSTVSGLDLRLSPGAGKTGLVLSGTATDVNVSAGPGVTSSVGVKLSTGATFRGGGITMPTPGDIDENDGFLVSGDPNTGQKTIEGATVVASNGVRIGTPVTLGSFVTIRGSRIIARKGVSLEQGQAFVDDTLIKALPAVPGSSSGGLLAIESPTQTADLRARHVTAIGPTPSGFSSGALAESGANLEMRNSVVAGFETDVNNLGPAGTTLTVEKSGFATKAGTVSEPSAGNTSANPSFVDPAGDFRLRFDSPLIDAGGAFGGPDADVDGNPRTVNGAPDIGAFEYQRRPPVPAIAVALGSPRIGDPVGFDGGGSSDPDPGDSPLAYAWTFDDGGAAAGPSIAHVFTTAGSHVATLTVTDPAGVSASLSRLVVISSGGGGAVLPPVAAISAFSTTNASFAVKPIARFAAKRKKPKRGTTFRYALSVAAKSTKVSFEALLPGKKSGRSCVKPTRKLTKAKGCTRAVAKGGISGPAGAGRNALSWDGRIKRKALPTGRYRATAQAADRFGRLSNKRTLSFSIVASG